MKKVWITGISSLILISLWEMIAFGINKNEIFPHFPKLVSTLAELFVSPLFYQSVSTTILRGITGILLSLFAASGIAILFVRFKIVYELFHPILIIFRSVPVISFILLALIFLNPESIPLVIGFLTMFSLLTENLTNGIQHLSPELTILGKQFHISKMNRFTQIYYPQLKPYLFSGLASAMGFGWRAIIMGEVLAQCQFGVGREMKKAQLFIDLPELMAWTFIAVVISFLFDKLINYIKGKKFSIFYKKNNLYPEISPAEPIRLKDISFWYDGKKVLNHFSFKFLPGTIYGISAPSGIGKTTLLDIINKTLSPQEGEVYTTLTNRYSNVFQNPLLLPTLTVQENIILPLSSYINKSTAVSLAEKILKKMEMEDYWERYPEELSYGQQQRVSIARALIYPGNVLLMDEPFKGLDEEIVSQIMHYIHETEKYQKNIIIFSSHRQEELNYLAGQIIKLI